ncbi:MAG: sulfite exporter TauE/SafE family protein [Pseudomonadota bacterium]
MDLVTSTELALLGTTAFVAGTVRGFSGFGSGLVFLPVTAQILPPFAALTTVAIADLLGAVPNFPRAVKECDRRDLLLLLGGLAVALPLGVWTLTFLDPSTFRYGVSALALLLLGCLLFGVRYSGPVPDSMVYATGGLSGFCCGVAGIPGPPVILFYMARPLAPQVIRANTFIFLTSTDLAMLPVLFAFGRLDGSAVLLGTVLIVPNMAGNLLGAWLFRPEYERLYRGLAYAVIAAMAVLTLPLWD